MMESARSFWEFYIFSMEIGDDDEIKIYNIDI